VRRGSAVTAFRRHNHRSICPHSLNQGISHQIDDSLRTLVMQSLERLKDGGGDADLEKRKMIETRLAAAKMVMPGTSKEHQGRMPFRSKQQQVILRTRVSENCLFELRDNRLPTSVPARNTRCLILNTTKLVLSLCPLFPQGSNERETLRQFVHFLPQLLHAAELRHQDVEFSSAMIAQGKWRHVWRMESDCI
jgi:hypothetical protein